MTPDEREQVEKVKPVCTKCGEDNVSLRHEYGAILGGEGDYLAAKCLRCGFRWNIPCLNPAPVLRRHAD